MVFWHCRVWGLNNLHFVRLFFPFSNRVTHKSQILSKLKFGLALLSLYSWKNWNTSSDSIFIFLSLTYKEPLASTLQILALITFIFVSSNVTLNIFLAVPFQIHSPLPSAWDGAISFLFSVRIKFILMPTGLQTLWDSLGLHKTMFSKLAVSYISPVSVSFVLFLLCVLCFGYLFASLLCGGNLHSSSLEDTISISKAER